MKASQKSTFKTIFLIQKGKCRADGSISMHLGTQIHSKTINADGSYQETLNSPEGLPVYEITQSADGCYNEIRYHSSGNPSKCIYSDPPAGIYYEESTYENGQMKYQISQDPHIVQETRYDEDGFMTYFHWKSADNELELFSDENGKLVKAIENGQTIEDPDTLLLLFGSYGFKK